MRHSRPTYTRQTLAAFVLPDDPSADADDDDDQQRRERAALQRSLRERIGDEADEHMQPDGGHEKSRPNTWVVPGG